MIEEVPLKRMATVIAGQSPPSSAVTDLGEDLPFLQGNAEFGVLNPVARYSCAVAPKAAEQGDILMSVRAPVGALNMADQEVGIGRGLCAIRPRSQAHGRFLWWAMHARRSRLNASAVGSTYNAVTADVVGALRIPAPPLAEQRAIAAHLDAETIRIDALIAKKRHLIELLDERFESAVFHAVTTGIRGTRPMRSSGLSWVGEVPAGWGTPTISANFDLQLGKMLSAAATEGPEQYPYVRNVNVQWDRFDLDDLAMMQFSAADRQRCELREGDLLVCEGGEVGRAAVWPGHPLDCFFQKAIHRVRPRAGSNSRFLMYCLRAAAKQSVFSVEGNQSTIVHLTGEQLRSHRFPWPPAAEQEEIVGCLDSLSSRREETRSTVGRQIDLLVEHRQALITAAVTGELSVPGVAA